jgi:hypothetical protein
MNDSDDLNWPGFPTVHNQIRPGGPETMPSIQEIIAEMPHARHFAQFLALIVNPPDYPIGGRLASLVGDIFPYRKQVLLSARCEKEGVAHRFPAAR